MSCPLNVHNARCQLYLNFLVVESKTRLNLRAENCVFLTCKEVTPSEDWLSELIFDMYLKAKPTKVWLFCSVF